MPRGKPTNAERQKRLIDEALAQGGTYVPVPFVPTPPDGSPPKPQKVVGSNADGVTRKEALIHSIKLASLPYIDTRNGEAVNQRCWEYVQTCLDDDMKPTYAGLALALHITRPMLNKWRTGAVVKPPEVMDAIDMACALIDSQMENDIVEGKGHPVGKIFLMKNNGGYGDGGDTFDRKGAENDIQESAKEIALRYQNIGDDD